MSLFGTPGGEMSAHRKASQTTVAGRAATTGSSRTRPRTPSTNSAATAPPPSRAGAGTAVDNGGRRRPPDAPVTGKASPRSTIGSGPTPPETIAGQSQASAAAAASRARRKGAGASVLTDLPGGTGSPGVRRTTRSLVGY